jgi:hypothetical protein
MLKKDTAMISRNLMGVLFFTLISLSFSSDNYIIPDDYPVTNDMFKRNYHEKNIESVLSHDNEIFFKNTELNETLYFELYTDYYRVAIYHFKVDFLFPPLIKQIDLWQKKDGMDVLADVDKKLQTIKKFIDCSEEIDKSYFKTTQGICLGINKATAIKKYGKVNSDTLLNDIDILKWDFQGDELLAATGEKPIGKIAKNSFGYHVIMYFKMDKLVAMILNNDIP